MMVTSSSRTADEPGRTCSRRSNPDQAATVKPSCVPEMNASFQLGVAAPASPRGTGAASWSMRVKREDTRAIRRHEKPLRTDNKRGIRTFHGDGICDEAPCQCGIKTEPLSGSCEKLAATPGIKALL